jgi:hypothetical protein
MFLTASLADHSSPETNDIIINEIMSEGIPEDILPEDRSNWAESQEKDGTPGEAGDPDTLPPVIVHTPVDQALADRPIYIHCDIYDPNDPDMYSAKEPTVYYRKTGETSFESTALGAFFGEYNGAIPASEVTTDGVEYYISTRDWSYNLATSPAFNPQSYPYEVEVVTSSDSVIRFTEVMYDPPGELPDESVLEWAEFHNVSSSRTVDLAGWKFTDLEGTYTFPAGSSITPGEYQVLCKTDDGPAGSFTRYTYGGSIIFSNPLGVFTDQLILKDDTGLIMEEVNYSANWGASNVTGPNNHTLEKIDPEGDDDGDNWMYSMAEGGTPGEESSAHFIFYKYETEAGWKTRPGISIEPTLINPGMEECTVYYRLDRDCDVTIKVYNTPGNIPSEDCYDATYYLVTLVDDESKTENMDPIQFSAHTAVWDGTYNGQTVSSNCCRIVLWATDTTSATSVCSSNDTMMTTLSHGFDPDNFYHNSHQPTIYSFYQSKPAFITVTLNAQTEPGGGYEEMRELIDDVTYPYPLNGEDNNILWDGRDGYGLFIKPFLKVTADVEAEDIFGNVVIARPKLFIFGAENTPRSYFNPDSSDTEMQVQTIYFNLIREAEVSMSIANQNEEWIAWPTVSSIPSRNQPYYSYKATWNGGTDNDGTYTYTIRAITIEDWNQWGEKARYSNEISLHRWE